MQSKLYRKSSLNLHAKPFKPKRKLSILAKPFIPKIDDSLASILASFISTLNDIIVDIDHINIKK